MGFDDIIRKAKKPKTLAVLDNTKKEQGINKAIQKALDNVKQLRDWMFKEYPDNYRNLTSNDDVIQYFKQVFEDGIVALDTETSGLVYLVDNVVGISMYGRTTDPVYIPIAHDDGINADIALVKEYMKELTERSRDGRLKVIFHNAKFDISRVKATFNFDEYINPYWDTMLGAKMLNENLTTKGGEYSLKYLFLRYVQKMKNPRSNLSMFKFGKLFDELGYNVFDPKDVFFYAAFDVVMTLTLYDFQAQYLGGPKMSEDMESVFEHFMTVEMPCIEPLASMEDNGLLVDQEINKRAIAETDKRIEQLTLMLASKISEKEVKVLIDKRNDLIQKHVRDTLIKMHKDPSKVSAKVKNRNYRLENILQPFLDYDLEEINRVRKIITKTKNLIKKKEDWKTYFKEQVGENYKDFLPMLQDLVDNNNDAFNFLRDYLKTYNETLDRFKTGNINWQSTDLKIVVFDIFGLKNGNPSKPDSLSKDRIEYIQGKYPDHYEMFDFLLELRKLTKLMTGFLLPLADFINPIDGKVHPNFNQLGTVTTRLSSNNPNVQQLPKKGAVRSQFIAELGRKLLGSDFSAQEPKVFSQVAQDMIMINAFMEGRDIYATVGSMVYGKPYEECLDAKNCELQGIPYTEGGDKIRGQSKVLILGILYGLGNSSIAGMLKITTDEAKDLMDRLYENMPAVREAKHRIEQEVEEKGYVKMLWGCKRRLPDAGLPEYEIKKSSSKKAGKENFTMYDQKKWIREFKNIRRDNLDDLKEAQQEFNDELIEKYGYYVKNNRGLIMRALRQGVNSIVQGTAAAMVKRALILIYNDEKMKELDFKLLVTVHDEIIGSAPDEHAYEAGIRLSELMVQAGAEKVDVPMRCDTEIMESWGGTDLWELYKEKDGKVSDEDIRQYKEAHA